MREEYFCKPLTPNLKADILGAINNMENELKTCENNAFVTAQLCALQAQKTLINALPDGYPMPMTRMVD